MTFADLKTAVKAVVFPIGEAENLVGIHDSYLVDALNQIQQYVRCYRDNNVNVISFGDTFYNCGLTVTDAPQGFIKRVYTIDSDGCCKVNLVKSSRAKLASMQAMYEVDFGEKTRPTQPVGKPALTLTDRYPDASADSKLGRAITGYWALEGCRMYVWPHLQSTEDLVIEWTGVKDSYADADTIFDSSTQVVKAARLFLQREIARDLDMDDAKLARYSFEYATALGDLVWKCRQKMEGTHAEEDSLPVLTNGCANPSLGTLGTLQLPGDTGVPDGGSDTLTTPPVTNPWLYRFAVIGKYGVNSNSSSAVASLVKSWKPLFVATTGGNSLDGATVASTIDAEVGPNYSSFIFPYTGSYTPGTGRNHFWPCISDYEWASANSRVAYKNYFPTPLTNGQYYYDHIEGPVHLFFLDSNAATPDGATPESAQAEWLRVKLATSPCKYKVVFMYHTPITSFADSAGVGAANWPFSTWGATAVISGSSAAYERLVSGGIPYIMNGLGGLAPEAPALPLNQASVAEYHALNGAQLVTVNCDSVQFDFYSVDGKLQDTLLIK